MALTGTAKALATTLLAGDPTRLQHVSTVAAQAERLSATVAAHQRDTLVAAAWLHDIGYSPEVADVGFHSLDGARYLRARDWPQQVCDLVAHHSGARYVAEVRGLSSQLDEFEFSQDPMSDALTIADQTSGPRGDVMALDDRMHNMLERHGSESPNGRAHPRRERYFRGALIRVTRGLEMAALAGDAEAADIDIQLAG